MDTSSINYEFLRPLQASWLAKLELAKKSKEGWQEISDECMMFYSQSASAMWNPAYAKKFWKGVKLPKFRITINKAFEMVAVYAPNLMWEYPHRTVQSKDRTVIDPSLMQIMPPEQQAIMQQLMQSQMVSEASNKVVASAMQSWLNYTPREQPNGGLSGHSKRCVVDSLIKGRGVLASRPYQMPGSQRTLTGSFYVSPDDILIDPDFDNIADAKWISIKHVDHSYDVEERFELPKGSLKGKSTLESAWQFGEMSTDDQSSAHRKAGSTSDMVVWYEIFSKGGCGCQGTNMEESIKNHFEQVVGKYAYLAICPTVPYPLNMPTEKLRSGWTDEQVKQSMSWPIPFHMDDRWPVEFLDYYHDPKSSWPIAPMAPGLGELKLLNFLVSWMANRVWSSSRDFWAVAGQHIEHYKEYILNGDDQAIIPTPVGVEDVSKAVSMITQPETRQDMIKLISFVSDMFDKRVAMTPFMYGLNQDGTQNRTAEETMAKSRAVQARPEYMAKQVVEWQSAVASSEAFVARVFVKADDVAAYMGPVGAYLWSNFVETTDLETIGRQYAYDINAVSIRRPDRDRDVANYQQVLQYFLGVVQQYGSTSGNYEPFNFLMQKWADFHDADLSGAMIPGPEEPTEEQQQMQALQMQEIQSKIQETMANAKAKEADAQLVMTEVQMKPVELQMEQAKMQMEMQMAQQEAALGQQDAELQQQNTVAKMQMDQAKMQMDLQTQQAKMQMDMEMQQAKMQMEVQKQQTAIQALEAKIQLEQAAAVAKMQIEQQSSSMQVLQDMDSHEQELQQDQEVHEQEMVQSKESAELANKQSEQIAKQKASAAGKPKETAQKPKPKSK